MTAGEAKSTKLRSADRVQWSGGVIGEAVDASYRNRLSVFIENEESEAVQFFSDAFREGSRNGDWYGEHVGKWLVAVSLAYRRTRDPELEARILQVTSYLILQQEPSGYLGIYGPDSVCRLTHAEVKTVRSWDLWIHAWVMQGLGMVASELSHAPALESAKRIGHLIVDRFSANPAEVLQIGNHRGLSSAVILEPLARLATATGEGRFADFAVSLVKAMEENGLPVVSGPSNGVDAADLGTGKSYQICWVLNGLVALSAATSDTLYLTAAAGWWENISKYHLSIVGGPWGGIGTHKEVFNSKGFFSPEGLTETCSTASWMSLCRELFLATGDPKYLVSLELALHNALLGAMDANGADWCYFTFPNGRRNNTYHWACCKSSGAMALEEVALAALTVNERGILVNLLIPFSGEVEVDGRIVQISVDSVSTDAFKISVSSERDVEIDLSVRIPVWASSCTATVGGEMLVAASPGSFMHVRRVWQADEPLELTVTKSLKVVAFTDALDHHGQEIVRTDYAALQYGEYIFACGLIDGFKKQETLRLPKLFPESPFELTWRDESPLILFRQPGRQPIEFLPYFQAGGRHDSGWRTTWIGVAWQ